MQVEKFCCTPFSSRLYKTETNYHMKLLWSKYTQKIRNGWKYIFHLVLREKSNAFRWYALAPLKNCYLLPAAPSVYEAVLMQFEPNKVLVSNQLPIFAKTKCIQLETT
jgi:hypothetical protein